MSTYTYTIRQTSGQDSTGRLEGSSLAEAIAKARKLDGTLMRVVEIKPGLQLPKFGKKKISLKDRIVFTEQLAVMLNAGITLVAALKGLSEESSNKGLALVLQSIIADVEGGMPFSSSLLKNKNNFSNIYCQMIKSAEKTGNLAGILNKLTIQQQKEYELAGKVRGALMYPMIVGILLVAVIIMVITFILPKLTGMFADSGTALPASTLFLMALSSFFIHQWYLAIAGVFGLVFIFKMTVKTATGRLLWDTYKLKFPVFGAFARKSCIARFSQSFASLAQAGVPVLEVFKTVQGVVGNAMYEVEIAKISRDVENGVKVSTAIRKSSAFPAMVGQLASVGEQSGDLAGVFVVLGDFFEKEVDGMAKNLSTLMEPIMMIVMGVGVGFVLVSILQPIYALTSSAGG